LRIFARDREIEKTMSTLITGGAGYIGSVTTEALREAGRDVIVLDSLVAGHRESVHPDVPFYEGDIADRRLVEEIFERHSIDSVVHFAAFLSVPESVADPAKYYRNNVAGTLELLDVMRQRGVNRIVFSSSSATYGEPQYLPMDEEHPQNPTTPYGMSKLFVERILDSFDVAYSIRHVALRYFNACGATTTRGEDHCPEIHLIPLVLFTALGRRPYISIYGTDYLTSDGTCVRDYVHVSDLAHAHVLALEYLEQGGESQKINLGNASGFSVRQIIDAAEKVTGRHIPVKDEFRRPGDPSQTGASIKKAKEVLGWSPRYTDIHEIIRTAWEWHRAQEAGQ
jgi:UDP-glucose 4-epimerase